MLRCRIAIWRKNRPVRVAVNVCGAIWFATTKKVCRNCAVLLVSVGNLEYSYATPDLGQFGHRQSEMCMSRTNEARVRLGL